MTSWQQLPIEIRDRIKNMAIESVQEEAFNEWINTWLCKMDDGCFDFLLQNYYRRESQSDVIHRFYCLLYNKIQKQHMHCPSCCYVKMAIKELEQKLMCITTSITLLREEAELSLDDYPMGCKYRPIRID